MNMKSILVAIACCLSASETTGRPQSDNSYKYNVGSYLASDSVAKNNNFQVAPAVLLAKDLRQPIQKFQPQFAQNLQSGQSFHIPTVFQDGNTIHQQRTPQQLYPQQQVFIPQQPAAQPIEVRIPIPNYAIDEKKIYVRLPQQQYPAQPQYQYLTPPRKHYKIILVRPPPVPTTPPQPVLPQIEEKTVIYVLVKKPEEPTAEELEKLHNAQQQSVKFNKPEVYFIKYKDSDKLDGDLSLEQQQAIDETIQKQLELQNNRIAESPVSYATNDKALASKL